MRKYQILNSDKDLLLFPPKVLVDYELGPITCYRIIALKDFTLIDGSKVRQGEIGGYVESENNLSQNGSCWIDKTSAVIHKGKLFDNVIMTDNSIFTGCGELSVIDKDGVEVVPRYGDVKISENDIIEFNPPKVVEDYKDVIKTKIELEEKYPPEVRAKQKIKNDFMKSKLNGKNSCLSNFITKEESTENILNSFSGMNEVYVVLDFNV